MVFKKTLLFLAFIPLLSFSAHKYYLSLTQIEYREQLQSVQIIINVFMDDIETALNKDYNIDLQLNTKKELINNDIYFQQYLEKKLLFKINDSLKKINYIGKEYDGNLVYFYLEIEAVEEVKKLELTNTILTTHFPKQQNLIKSKIGKKQKSILLNNKNNKALLKF